MYSWIIAQWVELAIALSIILLRVFVRCMTIGRHWSADDYLIWLAVSCITMFNICQYQVKKLGINQNASTNARAAWDLELRNKIETGSKWDFGNWWTYLCALWSLKGCMLVFYGRLTQSIVSRRQIKIYGAVIFLAWAASVVTLCTNCRPLRKFWQVYPPPGSCSKDVNIFIVAGIMNVFTDLLLVSIPIPLLWKARFPIRRKIFLAVLLCGGFFIMVAAIFRTVMPVVKANSNRLAASSSLLKNTSVNIGLANIEVVIASIVVNAPLVIPVFKLSWWNGHRRPGTLLGSLLGSTGTRSSKGKSQSSSGGSSGFGSGPRSAASGKEGMAVNVIPINATIGSRPTNRRIMDSFMLTEFENEAEEEDKNMDIEKQEQVVEVAEELIIKRPTAAVVRMDSGAS